MCVCVHDVVCNDHHFKDEFLFYRFSNDDDPSLRSRTLLKRDSRKQSHKKQKGGEGEGAGGGGGGGATSDDSGSYNESTENRHSSSSFGSEDVPSSSLQESAEMDE